MSEKKDVQELKVKEKLVMAEEKKPEINWYEQPKKHAGEELMKNLAVAASLVICAAVLRSGAIPPLNEASDVVMTAVGGDMLLDDQLGKLSFVSTMFPEATLVFGEQRSQELAMPVMSASVVHAWSQEEPYLSWSTADPLVTASMAGEVVGVYHGNGEEIIVDVMGQDNMSCLYGNLAVSSVAVGQSIAAGDKIGELLPGAECVLELRRDGYSVDPLPYIGDAS